MGCARACCHQPFYNSLLNDTAELQSLLIFLIMLTAHHTKLSTTKLQACHTVTMVAGVCLVS
jgi:hypothetical protein